MNLTSNKIFNVIAALFLVSLLFSFTDSARAQETDSQASGKDETKFDFYSEVNFEYSDNVYRLTEFQESLMKAGDLEDIQSGRFNNMESVSDLIVSPTINVGYDTKGLEGEKLRLTARVRYNYYIDNKESSYPEVRVRAQNRIGKNGLLTLEGNFLFDYFRKNYLTGYTDLNNNGNIPRDERIYSSAYYDEYEGVLTYKHRLLKNDDATLTQVDLLPFVGCSTRLYNDPFINRERDIFFGGLEAVFEFISIVDLDIVYQYEDVRGVNYHELVLFDETISVIDVNSDGRIQANAPLITRIDRSATRHTVEFNPSVKISKDVRLCMGYEYRISDFASENELDIDRYHQTTYRRQISAGVEYDFLKSWSAEVEYNKTDEEDDEDGDYSENCFTVSIRYDFP
jgi:hypothetical protein